MEIPGKYSSVVGELTIESLLGKGKSGYSYLAMHNGIPRVLKIMHDEPNPFYQFGGNKLWLEIEAYHQLKKSGILVPNLIAYDDENQYLIKEYINGVTAAQWIAERPLEKTLLSQLFRMAEQLERMQLNIDYFPTNFVIHRGKLYYIDFEVNAFDATWSLQKWGLYYWANQKGMALFLKTKDAKHINQSLEKGIPHMAPFEAQVQEWIEKYDKPAGINTGPVE